MQSNPDDERTRIEGTVRLDDWGLIRASGPDARTFLHGQLTQDMLHLEPGQARLAGYCSAKGRLQASFVVWRDGADDLLLACSADLLAATLKRLSMFVLRAKCKLVDASADLPLWGSAGPAQPGSTPVWSVQTIDGGHRVRLPHAEADGQSVERQLVVGAAPAGAAELAAETWRWLEARSGVVRIVAATVEQFVPQMVNLELVGGVDFQKGCYPGQEVVARSQYRGTLKRRARVFECEQPLQPGMEVFHSADSEQPAGMVVLAGCLGARCAALVEVKIAALAEGRLQAGGHALTLAALPYAIPTEAT
ncbi:MAG: folate-binding protein [Pseudomonadota bacterium]|nr:folate-binding protein [Pseudomonadota bacterium]